MNDQLTGAAIAIVSVFFGATLQYIFQFFTEKRVRNQVLEDRQWLRRREIFDKRAEDAEKCINDEFDSIRKLVQAVHIAKSDDLNGSIDLLTESNDIRTSSDNRFDAILVIGDDKLFDLVQEFKTLRDEITDAFSDVEAVKKKEDLEEYLSEKNISIMATKAALVNRLDQLRGKR